MGFDDYLQIAEQSGNLTIFTNLVKAYHVINRSIYKVIVCSISGGSDSDLIIDICEKVKEDKKIIYVWFDTGLEYKATKEHLKFLEQKYGVKIHRERAIKPIPIATREYGQPFLSKQVSEFIARLQRHDFKWEDEPFEVLYQKYPKCKAALKWWCNQWGNNKNGYSKFNINYNKYLKEFIIANQPDFKIANKCCTYAKKNVSKEIIKRYKADLMITGVRKSEGGARSSAYKSCFSNDLESSDDFRPIFWYKNQDKIDYEHIFGITHSACYSEYGMIRTGCAGCPFNLKIEDEVKIIEQHEPKLYKAVNKIFRESYNYTRKYREFCKEMSLNGISDA